MGSEWGEMANGQKRWCRMTGIQTRPSKAVLNVNVFLPSAQRAPCLSAEPPRKVSGSARRFASLRAARPGLSCQQHAAERPKDAGLFAHGLSGRAVLGRLRPRAHPHLLPSLRGLAPLDHAALPLSRGRGRGKALRGASTSALAHVRGAQKGHVCAPRAGLRPRGTRQLRPTSRSLPDSRSACVIPTYAAHTARSRGGEGATRTSGPLGGDEIKRGSVERGASPARAPHAAVPPGEACSPGRPGRARRVPAPRG